MTCLFGHKWDGCKCTKCGKTRDEGHDWDLCKGVCKICGKTRAPEHDWNGCVCRRCKKKRDASHNWKGCKCVICGKTRDEGHNWNGCTCRRCKKWRNEQHKWNGCICKVCGWKRDEEHDWDGCTCKRCGAVRITGHTWENGKCTMCGMKWYDSYDYAVQLMDEGKYESAIWIFKGMKDTDGQCREKIRECIPLIYERDTKKIAQNDPSEDSYSLDDRLDNLETTWMGSLSHPLYDQLLEQRYQAFRQNIEKKDYENARRWYSTIEHTGPGKNEEILRCLYKAAKDLMQEQNYGEAMSWLYKVRVPAKSAEQKKIQAECREAWKRDPKNPSYCPKSPDLTHSWETVESVKTIDGNLRKAGHGKKRCKYCGKAEVFSYDYDTDGY